MLTFLQFVSETVIAETDYYSTPTHQYYSYFDHPKLGLLVKKGAHAHTALADHYGFEKTDTIPRGWFSIDKKKKLTAHKHYDWTGQHSTNLVSNIRRELKVPKTYRHNHSPERAW